MRWGTLGIGLACGALVWSYQETTHWGPTSGWVSLAVIGGLIWLFAMWSGRDRSVDAPPEKEPGKDLDLRR